MTDWNEDNKRRIRAINQRWDEVATEQDRPVDPDRKIVVAGLTDKGKLYLRFLREFGTDVTKWPSWAKEEIM